jgi:N-acetylglutamate synthase-like GNAT family acetyltransferase
MIRPFSSTTTKSVVRKAVSTDCAAVAALIREFGYAVTEELIEQWLVRISSGACGAVFVTEHDGEVAGFLNFHIVPLLQFSGGLGRITAVGVGSRFRHLGVGRQLVAAAEQFAWAHGCARVAANHERASSRRERILRRSWLRV